MDSNSDPPQPPPQPSNSHTHPQRNVPPHKPRSICRNFVYHGVCKDMSCPRAHVPHADMLDLVSYLLERNDCPPELRSVRQRLTPPKRGACRAQLPSDRICRYFLPVPCPSRGRCFRAHFSVASMYGSLQLPLKRAKTQEADVNPQVESEARSP
ncbi:hypothetical protein EI94DRAFT_53785 [Lactarius quietus]|nr:hypothetical protein EI94DRAFT_53785 [Lactarius quietus]